MPESPDEVAGPTPLRCSAKGCRSGAAWALRWNNPRLHGPDRRKTWLACDAHRDHLGEFLDRRGFLREVVPAQALQSPESLTDGDARDPGHDMPT